MTIKIILVLMTFFSTQKEQEIPQYVHDDVLFQLHWEEFRQQGLIQLQEIE